MARLESLKGVGYAGSTELCPLKTQGMPLSRALWAAAKANGMTMEAVGVAMSYPQVSARKGVRQFFQGHVPRIDVLRNFSKAIKVSLADIVGE